MSIDIKRRSQCQLFQQKSDREKILFLDNQDVYLWKKSHHGDYLAIYDKHFTRGNTLYQGDYIMMTAHNEPGWENDVEYLELKQNDNNYQTYKLPYGLPIGEKQQKKIIKRNYVVSAERIDELVH